MTATIQEIHARIPKRETFETYAGGKKFSELSGDQQKALRGWWSKGKKGAPPVPVDSKQESKDAAKKQKEEKKEGKAQRKAERRDAGRSLAGDVLKRAFEKNKKVKEQVKRIAEKRKARDEKAGKEVKSDKEYEREAAKEFSVGLWNTVKKQGSDMYKNTEADMLKDGVPRAIAAPIALSEAVTGALQLPSPIQLALTAMGQGWVNAIPGVGMVELAVMPKAVSAVARGMKKAKSAVTRGGASGKSEGRQSKPRASKRRAKEGVFARETSELVDAARVLKEGGMNEDNAPLFNSILFQFLGQGVELDEAVVLTVEAYQEIENE